MNITPNKLNIAQLFSANNEQFIVPAYQRRYAWGVNQTKALFDDIKMLKDSDGHLFGMIILHTSNIHKAGLYKPELVDGQQRLTSMTILLKALQTRFKELKNKERVNQIEAMLNCSGYDNQKKPKMILGNLDNEDYISIMKGASKYTYINQNIISSYDNFLAWAKELEDDELNKFYFTLTNIAVIIRLDVLSANDAYKLFETINNRGLRLSPTDIIKNFLLGHASKIGIDNLVEVKVLWSNIIKNLDGLNSDDFFRQYLCSLLQRKISMSKLVYEFKRYYFKQILKTELLGEFKYYVDDLVSESEEEEVDVDDVEDKNIKKISNIEFLHQIIILSKTYNQINYETFSNSKLNRRINNLNRILSMPTYIFLMHFMQSKHTDSVKISVLKLLETFMLRRHICEMRTNEHDDIFAKILQYNTSDDIVNEVKEYLQNYLPNDDDFKVRFPKHNFKGRLINRAKYILEQIEYFERGNTNELIVSSQSEVELEHIIPQNITSKRSKEEFGNWSEYLGKQSNAKHKIYIDLIGNMTLLGDKLNITASNNPFHRKKKSYEKSSFKITEKIADRYNEFKFPQVEERGNELAELAIKIWTY
jgi:uncharacterized protein with ParB-like and HNH nuclease domain